MEAAGKHFNSILPMLYSLLFLSSIDTVLSVHTRTRRLFRCFSKFRSMLYIKLCVNTMSKFSHTHTHRGSFGLLDD